MHIRRVGHADSAAGAIVYVRTLRIRGNVQETVSQPYTVRYIRIVGIDTIVNSITNF